MEPDQIHGPNELQEFAPNLSIAAAAVHHELQHLKLPGPTQKIAQPLGPQHLRTSQTGRPHTATGHHIVHTCSRDHCLTVTPCLIKIKVLGEFKPIPKFVNWNHPPAIIAWERENIWVCMKVEQTQFQSTLPSCSRRKRQFFGIWPHFWTAV